MLGKLAKWLKILGFDTLYFRKIEDSELLALAQKERRVLLTRDVNLLQKSRNLPSLFIRNSNWDSQLLQVLNELNLWKKVQPNTRCIHCNQRLKSLPKKRARNLVSPFVYESARSFAICPQCGKVFWQGTHFRDMEIKIEELFRERNELKNEKED